MQSCKVSGKLVRKHLNHLNEYEKKQRVVGQRFITEEGPPLAPNKFTPRMASSAATTIPIEDAFSSGVPWLILFPLSQTP
jgi:hypothetical protein